MRVYSGLDVSSDFGGRFPWKSHLIRVDDGVRQAVIDEGPRDSPATFLLLHGNPTWSYLYRHFIERLSGKYRVIAPDHAGFGRSDKPRDPRWYTLDRHISNLRRVLDELQAERVVPVLQDWGGPIGMGWATRHPGRVKGVVVLNTWAFVRNPRMKLPRLFKLQVLGKSGWKRAVQSNIFVEKFLKRGHGDDFLNAYRAPFPTPDDRIGVARFPQLIPETKDHQHESWATMAAIEDGLERLRAKPALICWARRDRAFSKQMLQGWTRAFDNVDGPWLLSRAGHFLQEDAGDAIIDHMERWAAEKL
jgi:haloalkane dehalogenase